MAEIEEVLSIELDRAVRLGRPLSLLVGMRRDIPMALSNDMLEQASVAIRTGTRAYDSAGLIDSRAVVVVLHETDSAGARIVADRLRAELAHRSDGRRVWTILEMAHIEQLGGAPRVIANNHRRLTSSSRHPTSRHSGRPLDRHSGALVRHSERSDESSLNTASARMRQRHNTPCRGAALLRPRRTAPMLLAPALAILEVSF